MKYRRSIFRTCRRFNSPKSDHRGWLPSSAAPDVGILFITDDEIAGIGVRLSKKKTRR